MNSWISILDQLPTIKIIHKGYGFEKVEVLLENNSIKGAEYSIWQGEYEWFVDLEENDSCRYNIDGTNHSGFAFITHWRYKLLTQIPKV